MKWMHWNCKFAGEIGSHVLVTEDIFSMYKARHALGPWTEILVCCSLGASAGPAAVLALKDCTSIGWLYDGDKAGDEGAKQARKRMQPFGMRQYRPRPPQGLDPKDMHINDLRELILTTMKGTP